MLEVKVFTLYPDLFPGPLDIGIFKKAKENKEVLSIAYQGNVIDVWEAFYEADIFVELGSDQTSLHNPWAGGY